MTYIDPERRREIIEGFPPSAAGYLDFLNFELAETAGSMFFKIESPAPEDLSTEQLEAIASDLTDIGWKASVGPLADQEGEIRFGIRITSDDPQNTS